MATFSFYSDGNLIGGGSGLGFYGDAGFGASILVGAYNGRTFITNGAGSDQGPEGDNLKYLSSGSGIIGQAGSGIPINKIPNDNATLRINFSHTSSVVTSNAYVRLYDRVSTSAGPSGVTSQVAVINHVSPLQTVTGSGDSTWRQINAGVASSILLPVSPGPLGANAGNGSNSTTPSTSHDWYLGISVSPDSIGSKTQFSLYVSTEYL